MNVLCSLFVLILLLNATLNDAKKNCKKNFDFCKNSMCNCPEGLKANKDNSCCKPICENKCIGGKCVGKNKCKCLPGYTVTNDPFVCEPFCSDCTNGYCYGYEKCATRRSREIYSKPQLQCSSDVSSAIITDHPTDDTPIEEVSTAIPLKKTQKIEDDIFDLMTTESVYEEKEKESTESQTEFWNQSSMSSSEKNTDDFSIKSSSSIIENQTEKTTGAAEIQLNPSNQSLEEPKDQSFSSDTKYTLPSTVMPSTSTILWKAASIEKDDSDSDEGIEIVSKDEKPKSYSTLPDKITTDPPIFDPSSEEPDDQFFISDVIHVLFGPLIDSEKDDTVDETFDIVSESEKITSDSTIMVEKADEIPVTSQVLSGETTRSGSSSSSRSSEITEEIPSDSFKQFNLVAIPLGAGILTGVVIVGLYAALRRNQQSYTVLLD